MLVSHSTRFTGFDLSSDESVVRIIKASSHAATWRHYFYKLQIVAEQLQACIFDLSEQGYCTYVKIKCSDVRSGTNCLAFVCTISASNLYTALYSLQPQAQPSPRESQRYVRYRRLGSVKDHVPSRQDLSHHGINCRPRVHSCKGPCRKQGPCHPGSTQPRQADGVRVSC